ncbi:MAG: vitamin B12-dependent ribonucleotide reductase [Candidatus Latescibacteria bacterium]|nr:vitamin B12-dependent ribonucleotide reductase [Candidatus Latescibacterota bacterium]
MKISRRFTTPDENPLDQVNYTQRTSIITNPDGSEVFRMDNVEVPETWSQLATDIVVSKYFRKGGVPKTQHETSVRQVVHRIANTVRKAGEDFGNYFDSPEDADAFEAELAYHLIHQKGAFNSPVWFNCGLYHQYKIKGSGGSWYWDPKKDKMQETKDAYSHPQCSACYIQSVEDDMMSIFDLIKNEAWLFKYGSGTGTNFSKVRGKMETLSGGGTSSGLMSFLEVFDRAAGATKSGGITRRAAKMVCLDMDHPEIVEFINWKSEEEKKVAALIAGGYSSDFNGEAYKTVSGQNSNNSIRITDEFMQAVENDGDWHTTLRTTGEIHETFKARDLMDQISNAAWACADPGMQYDTTINKWHTAPNTGRINSSNPCSEYMYLDDSACNLASVNLLHYLNEDGSFDIEGFRFACKLFFLAQEIMVDLASYPTKTIGQNSHDFRPLGLGYANLGSLLMVMGLPYDSDEGRAICSAITAIMCGHAYAASAEIASTKSAFPGFEENRDPMLNVMKMHQSAAHAIDTQHCPADLFKAACEDWDTAVALGEQHGYRNGQATVIAPTGTIGLLMDCDTTGIEPDFALVKFKKLSGGGYFKIVNASVPRALENLGYSASETKTIVAHICGTLTLNTEAKINASILRDRGLTNEDIEKIENALPGAFELSQAVSPWVLGKDTMQRLEITPEQYQAPTFNLLATLGFSTKEINTASDIICGQMTIEGAPNLKAEHLPVFDCANKCGNKGTRFIAPMAHISMMAAAQPFISGAISKTVNVPHETTAKNIQDIYLEGWKLGLKAVAIYRDGSKLSQPLNSTSSDSEEETETVEEAKAAPIPEIKSPKTVDPTAVHVPQRRRLPKKRQGFTQEARVAGHKVFLRTGEYENGDLGEIFIDMQKEGAPFRSMLNCFAIAISKGLQYGVPVEDFVDTFTFTRFEPWGSVEHPNIKFSTSVIDYIFRVVGYEYLGRTDFLQVKPEDIVDGLNQPDQQPQVTTENATAETPAAQSSGEPETSVSNQTTTSETAAKEDTVPNASATGNGATEYTEVPLTKAGVLDEQLSQLMGDAPFCDSCGHITVRNGSCYRCLNCGNSMGCS